MSEQTPSTPDNAGHETEFGSKLAGVLNRAIDSKETKDRPRAAIIDDMGKAGGIAAGTVNQILEGSINCPPIERLRGFARVLDVSVETLTAAGNEDGCKYSAQPEKDESQMSSASQPDLEETKRAAKREEAKRHSDIRALCATAGMPEKADAFCENLEFSVSDVRAALFESLCKRNKTPADEGNESVPGQSAADPDKAFQEEYREQSALFSEQGISEEQYVASRRIDEGLDHLAMLTPAT